MLIFIYLPYVFARTDVYILFLSRISKILRINSEFYSRFFLSCYIRLQFFFSFI
jgi:hypothetical protein